ncbi:MAG: methylmalonyl Co-A mutase-associated GTPase MeaB [Pseudomonadota bacterium]
MTNPWRHASDAGSAADLAAATANGERRALAQTLTELERAGTRTAAMTAALRQHLELGKLQGVVGITGPPGAGKSTLVNALIETLRARGQTIGIIAIDPSSPVSGGAILGDRMRMTAATGDDGVFVRSLSASGHLGGMTPAAVRMIDAFDVAGFDVVIVETVGAGQSEVDVAAIADVRLVIAAPGLGDDIQAMKSGLLEIADVLVVTKADRPGAAQTRQQLAGALSLRLPGGDARRADAEVLAVSALTGDGMAALTDALIARLPGRAAETRAAARARRGHYLLRRELIRAVEDRVAKAAAADRLGVLVDGLIDGTGDADSILKDLLSD